MKTILKHAVVLVLVLASYQSNAQGVRKYSNNLFLEYGFMQYNSQGEEFINKDDKFLSLGLGYNKDIFSFLSLGIKTKYYRKNNANAEGNTLGSNAAQLHLRLQMPRISPSYRVRRLTPYVGLGFGYAIEHLNNDIDNRTDEYLFVPLMAGIDYNFSSSWSLGVNGEYRASAKKFSTLVDNYDSSLNKFNSVSVRLNFYFGAKQKRPTVQPIYIRQTATYSPTLMKASQLVPQKSIADTVTKLSALKETHTITENVVLKDTAEMNLQVEKLQLVKSDSLVVQTDTTRAEVAMAKSKTDSLLAKTQQMEKDSVRIANKIDSVIRAKRAVADTLQKPIALKADSVVKVDSVVNLDSAAKKLIDTANVQPVQKTASAPNKLALTPQNKLIDTNVIAKPTKEAQTMTARGVVDKTVVTPSTYTPQQQGNPVPIVLSVPIQSGGQKPVTDNYRSGDNKLAVLPVTTNVPTDSLAKDSLALKPAENRLDSVYRQLSMIQAKLEKLSAQAAKDQKDAANVNAKSDEQNQLKQQIKRLEKDNETLQLLLKTTRQSQQPNAKSELPETTQEVYFKVDQHELDTELKQQLTSLAKTIKANKTRWVLLEGFTDKSGNAKYNLQLSKKRVNAVKSFLTTQGIEKQNILEKTFGSQFATEEVNKNERKVKITLID